MDFIVNNWQLFVAAAALIVAGLGFFTLPIATQKKKVMEWLIWAVAEAEKELGEKTGALKLRFVYDLFVEKFTWIAKIISFEKFSEMVDEALKRLEELLKNNEALQNYINK